MSGRVVARFGAIGVAVLIAGAEAPALRAGGLGDSALRAGGLGDSAFRAGGLRGSAFAAQAPVEKVPIVAVAGCLTEQGENTWMLTSATDPEPSIANGPPAGQPYKGPTSGKNAFRLIGVSEYDLPSHTGHTVLVKALFIKAEPVSRLNITSVTMIAENCPPK